jgi:acyl carrier protein
MALSFSESRSASALSDAEAAHETAARVMNVLKAVRARSSTPLAIAEDTRLADAGFTSLEMVDVMLAIEAEFGLELPQAEITPENFTSAASIALMLRRLSSR